MEKIIVIKYTTYEFSYDSCLFEIECRGELCYSYITKDKRRIWMENKDYTLFDAIQTCLKYIGMPLQKRNNIKIQFNND